MSTVANYVVIKDTSFTLEPGKTQAYTFNLPADIVVSGFSKSPVVAFVTDSSDANGLDCRIFLNNVQVVKLNYSGGGSRGHWEVITHSNLEVGKANNIQFTVNVGGSGSIRFSDIILWFQKNV